MKLISYIRNNIDVILLSMVICINCIRVILGLGETTIILYGLYLLCLFELVIKNSRSFARILKKDKIVKAFLVVMSIMVLYAAISLVWIPSNETISIFLKFVLSLMIGVYSVAMPIEKIKGTLNWIIIINVAYSIILLVMPTLADHAMGAGLNYLNATLPLGLALTMTLIKSLDAVSNKGGIIMSVVRIAISGLYFLALMGFVARGVMIFPPLIAVVMFLFMEKKHKYVAWLLIPVFAGVLYLFFVYYMTNASDYAMSRMTNLLESSEDEDRWDLWSKALIEMEDRLWFIVGGGLEAFRYNSSIHYYPHNIFIQVIGEYGMIGIAVSIMTLWSVAKGFIKSRTKASQAGESVVLYCTMGAFIYYTLTFSKSFSLYDGLPLFVMIAFCLSLTYQLKGINKGRIALAK